VDSSGAVGAKAAVEPPMRSTSGSMVAPGSRAPGPPCWVSQYSTGIPQPVHWSSGLDGQRTRRYWCDTLFCNPRIDEVLNSTSSASFCAFLVLSNF